MRASLLGIPADGPALEFTPQRQKQFTLQALVDQLAGLTTSAPVLLLVRAWEAMGMREHLQMSADVMSIMEKTSDAVALRERLRASGLKPRQLAED